MHADAAAGPRVYRPTIKEQLVGPDAKALADNVDADYQRRRANAGVRDGDPLPDTRAELAGYRIESYQNDSAFLRLLVSSPGPDARSTVYVDFRVEVRWTDGDWRVIAPVAGQWRNATGQVPSPAGYAKFPDRR